jgi:hypothetical protein
VSDRSAVWLIWCRWVWVGIDDFIAALLAISDNAGHTAEYPFALLICSLLAVAIEDLGVRRETTRWLVCWESVMRLSWRVCRERAEWWTVRDRKVEKHASEIDYLARLTARSVSNRDMLNANVGIVAV